ncbi:hypothetical protein OPV22_015080 [Ensete ventricosum]|uniref:Uncharacterized protein n=1 Tax=Ensete ventricosum TaxID=4639 RepID=A0AAV8PKY7_ENSVE|nr:hypothetical protein OPV22_015080 [Ensete ventricosum]
MGIRRIVSISASCCSPPIAEPSTNLFVSGEPLVLPFLTPWSSFLSSLLVSLFCVSRAPFAVADHINWRKALPLIPIVEDSSSLVCRFFCLKLIYEICLSRRVC